MKMSRKGNYDVESSDNDHIEDEDDLLPKKNKGAWDKLSRRFRVKRLPGSAREAMPTGRISGRRRGGSIVCHYRSGGRR